MKGYCTFRHEICTDLAIEIDSSSLRTVAIEFATMESLKND